MIFLVAINRDYDISVGVRNEHQEVVADSEIQWADKMIETEYFPVKEKREAKVNKKKKEQRKAKSRKNKKTKKTGNGLKNKKQNKRKSKKGGNKKGIKKNKARKGKKGKPKISKRNKPKNVSKEKRKKDRKKVKVNWRKQKHIGYRKKKSGRKQNKSARKKNKPGRETNSSCCVVMLAEYSKVFEGKSGVVMRQYNRIQNFEKLTGTKMRKKGNFNSTYKSMLGALGGNSSSPHCDGQTIGSNSTSKTYQGIPQYFNQIIFKSLNIFQKHSQLSTLVNLQWTPIVRVY